MANGKKKPIISDDCLQLLKRTIEEHKGTSRSEESDDEDAFDPTDSGNIIAHLVDALCFLTKEIQRLKGSTVNPLVQSESEVASTPTQSHIEERLRLTEDEVDEGRQRQLKGNLILSSSKKGQNSLIKSAQELNGRPLLDHINELLITKYGVSVPYDDVQACHHLPNGSVVLRIWRRTEDSAWSKLVQAIRSKPISSINFYANFHMTGRRNEILYQLRQLRHQDKGGYQFKLFTDENGSIAVKFPDSDKKYKITYHRSRGKQMKTYTRAEILSLFSAQQRS